MALNLYEATHLTKMEGVTFCSLYVCPLIFLTTVHSMDFTFGRCTAKDPRKCSVEYELSRSFVLENSLLTNC